MALAEHSDAVEMEESKRSKFADPNLILSDRFE